MTRQELVTRLTLYKKEVFRRGLVIALAVMLPGVAVFLGIGFWRNPFPQSTTFVVLYFGSFVLFVAAMMFAFIYMVCKSLPRKLDLLCPQCGALVLDTPAQELISTGKCSSCGAVIVCEEHVQPVKAEVVNS